MAREDTRSPRASPSKRQRTLERAPTIKGEPSRKAGDARNGGGSSFSSSSSSSLCCGICLSSVGERAIRGQIDSCDHYFCFMCIREWAKVESKCPMCKRRFSSIRRPAVEGIFDTERVVYVPHRDQRPPDDGMNGLSEVSVPEEDDYASNQATMWTRHSEEFDERGRGITDSSYFSDGSRYTSRGSYEGGENSLGDCRQAESRSSRGRMSDGSDANCVDYGAESSWYSDCYGDILALLGSDGREEHNGNVGAGSSYHGTDSTYDSWGGDYERQIRFGDSIQDDSWSNRHSSGDVYYENHVESPDESNRYVDQDDGTRSQVGTGKREEVHDESGGHDSPYRKDNSPYYHGSSYGGYYEDHVNIPEESNQSDDQDNDTCSQTGTDSNEDHDGSSSLHLPCDDSPYYSASSNDDCYEDHVDIPEGSDQYDDLDDDTNSPMGTYSRKEEHDGSGDLDSPYPRDESPYYCGRSDDTRRNQSTPSNGSDSDRSDDDEWVDYGEESSQYSHQDDHDYICSQTGADSGQHPDGSSGAGSPYWVVDSPSPLTGGSSKEDREQDEFLFNGGNNNDNNYDDHVDYCEDSSHHSDQDDATHSQTDIDSREEHNGSSCTESPDRVINSASYSRRSSNREIQSGAGRRDESWSNRSDSIDCAREVNHVEYGKESSTNSDLDIHAHSLTGSACDLCWPERGGYICDEHGKFASRSFSQRSPVSPSYSDRNEHRESTSPACRAPGISPGTGIRSFQSHGDHVTCLDFHGFELPRNQIKYLEGVYDLEGAFWEDSMVCSKGIRTAALSALGEMLVLASSEWSSLSKENLQHIIQTMHDVVSLGFKLSCLRSLTKKCKDRLNLLKEIEDLSLEKADLESLLLHAKTKLNQLNQDLEEVYDPLGIRTVDPYAESQCSVCNGSEDEWFLLLCDLCNIASHTYCVGLGFTVPMGDWFCPDCATLRESQANGEGNDEAHSSLLLSIVREGSCSEINRPATQASPPLNPSSFVNSREEGPFPAHESKVPLFGARTRHWCRDVHSRIQALRENWDALRHGSVNFSLGPIESIDKENSKEQQESLPRERNRLGKVSSSGFQQSTDGGGENQASFSHDKVLDDVSKAWRMMDLAKSRQQGHNHMIIVQHAARDIIMKGKASERGGSIYRNLSYLSNYSPADKQKDRRTFESTNHSAKVGAAKSPTACLNFPYLRTKPVRSGNRVGASQDIGLGTTLHVNCPREMCTHMISLGSSGEGSSHAVSVKSEIQSLVKRKLKMLIGGKQLGVNAFKEIARASTHNILAACGLEHSKAIQYSSFASPVCPHPKQDKLQHKSSPMPNSCRDCFNSFMKNVVSSIMQEKMGHAQ